MPEPDAVLGFAACRIGCAPAFDAVEDPAARRPTPPLAGRREAWRGLKSRRYVLIHGSGSDSWYWHRVAPLLRQHGNDVVPPDLPSGDDRAGLREYADAVVDAIGDRRRLVVVAQSLAGFTAPLVCSRVPVDLVILVAAMVPLPAESPNEWFATPGGARRGASRANGAAALPPTRST